MNQHRRRNAIAVAKADDSHTQKVLALTYTAAAVVAAAGLLAISTLWSF